MSNLVVGASPGHHLQSLPRPRYQVTRYRCTLRHHFQARIIHQVCYNRCLGRSRVRMRRRDHEDTLPPTMDSRHSTNDLSSFLFSGPEPRSDAAFKLNRRQGVACGYWLFQMNSDVESLSLCDEYAIDRVETSFEDYAESACRK